MEIESSGYIEVEYQIVSDTIDGDKAFWWVAGNGSFEEDEYYTSLKAAESALKSYFK